LKVYLGIDVGSVSTKLAVVDENNELISHIYLPTQGDPVRALQKALRQLKKLLSENTDICGVATTGSARYLAGAMVGADCIKNEITSQAVAALYYMPDVQTVIEVGGQDSKIIIIRDGVVADFGMNTVCAAGTGSFLDHQAQRLEMSIWQFSRLATASAKPVNITGRCTVFAESNMVHKQQTGHRTEDIAYGLCRTLVGNYLSNVASGKDIKPPMLFQGGVAFNEGMVRAFKEELGSEIIVPPHPEMMGAIGAALLVREELADDNTSFLGFGVSEWEYTTASFECQDCHHPCQITQLSADGRLLASWGGRCHLWTEKANTGSYK
jgi:predicted CoA-substrate-specific enzyme activase